MPIVSGTSSRRSSFAVRYASPPDVGGTSSQKVPIRRYVSKAGSPPSESPTPTTAPVVANAAGTG